MARFAVMRFGHCRVGLKLGDELVVGVRLLEREINVEDKQRYHADDRYVIWSGTDFPKLSPVHKFSLV